MTELITATATAETTAPGATTIAVSAPVDDVLVLEDRAQVCRVARVHLGPGLHRVVVEPVTPLAGDGTLVCRAHGEARDGVRVLDVRLRRDYVQRAARPDEEQALTAALEALVDEYLADHDQGTALLAERRLVGQTTSHFGGHVRERLAVGSFEKAWAGRLEALFARRAELDDELLALDATQADRRVTLRRLEAERDAALAPVPEYRGRIETEVELAADTEVEFAWEYQVPCALWRPEYTAELVTPNAGGDAPPTVRWESAGTVWQYTGEDWDGVTLRFSTARPTLGAELPLLDEDVLAARQKSDEERHHVAVTSRDEAIARTGTVEEEQVDTPPGLDDGGEARTFSVPERVSVPSDGRPHALPYDAWEAPATVGLRAVPERGRYVFLRSEQANGAPTPLLAGPVSLVRDGGFVGRSEVGFVAPGERFALSWGSEDDLVLLHERSRHYEETGLRKTRHYRFDVTVWLSNHGAAPATVDLRERIPVSEIEDVETRLLKADTTPDHAVDEQGVVRWTVPLAPGEERTVTLAFDVTMPQRVHWDG